MTATGIVLTTQLHHLASLAKWLSVRLRTKWLWVRFPLQSLNDDFVADFVDSPKEGVEQHKKREYLRGVISKSLLRGGKKQWTYERFGKVINKTIDKVYAG